MTAIPTLDDELIAQAKEVTGVSDLPELLQEGLRALIAREAARRVIALGGIDPGAKAPPRRRSAL